MSKQGVHPKGDSPAHDPRFTRGTALAITLPGLYLNAEGRLEKTDE